MTQGLSVQGLTAGYATAPGVLTDLDLAAPRGAVTALLGPNGAGKSTLLKAILGFVSGRGQIELDGSPVADLKPLERARRLAYVPQRSVLTARLPVATVVGMGRFASTGIWGRASAQDRRAVTAALAEVNAEHLAQRIFTELSGGERQRVLLARALATGATTILLDEPTSSLDVKQVLSFHQMLCGLATRNFCLLMVLHDLDEARRHADRGILMDHGRVHIAGPIADVIDPTPILQVYGVELQERQGLSFRLPGTG